MTKDTAAPKAKAAAQAAEVQAEGLSVYRVFWLFLMASFFGRPDRGSVLAGHPG